MFENLLIRTGYLLMQMSYYSDEDRFYVAIDCIIFGFNEDDLKLLLLKRDFEPAKGEMSLIGGFLKKDESLDMAAKRILHNLTGLENVYLEQLYTHGEPGRDPGERVISVAYFALLKTQDLDPGFVKKHGAHWRPVSDIPDLIFDHNLMVEKAMKRLQRRAQSQPVGFELLPKEFTLPQIQNLYEAIYQKKLDDRNFRKKLLKMKILNKLEEKDKSSSKKGAYLFRFDKEKYDSFVNDGFSFDL